MSPVRGSAAGPVTLAHDRQLQRGVHILGLFLIVWGGMFGGMPLAMLFAPGRIHGDVGVIPLFMLFGFTAFFGGLYLVLVRKEVRLDATRTYIEERRNFLGSVKVRTHIRQLFDRVDLSVKTSPKGAKSYAIALLGKSEKAVSLGDFSERNEALTAGMRAARAAGLAFDETLEAGTSLRLAPEELAKVPVAPSPEEQDWWRRPSALALLAANLVPVFGVLFGGWQILSVMLLFWLENVIVGLFNVARILLARGASDGSGQALPAPFAAAGNLFVAAFFTVHYGMFCAVHGIFVVSLFGRGPQGAERSFDIPDLPRVVIDLLLRHGLLWAVIALVASHGLSFYIHYLRPRAFEDADAGKIMFEPYKRVVILHVVLIVGGFAAAAFGASLAPLLMLIALKIAVDLNAHRREHAVPYEREMRDFMAENAHRFVCTERPPAAAAAMPAMSVAPAVPDRNDQPLAHYAGAWRADPRAAVPPGWIARAEFRAAGGKTMVRLWSQAAAGLADEGEFEAALRGNAQRVEFIEARQRSNGRARIARFTGSDAGASHVDLNEIQHPEGNPKAMQARSLTLQRA
jgi:hypothetical protein